MRNSQLLLQPLRSNMDQNWRFKNNARSLGRTNFHCSFLGLINDNGLDALFLRRLGLRCRDFGAPASWQEVEIFTLFRRY